MRSSPAEGPSRRTACSGAWIALAACIGLLVLPADALGYEPQPSPGVEGVLAHPPGMPPVPASSAEGRAAAGSPQQGGSTSPLSTEPLQALAGHGRYWGLSLVGVTGGHPIRRPRELWLAFGTITEYGGEDLEEGPTEYAVLAWESNCNWHSYKVEANPTRLNLSDALNSRVRCAGRIHEEERWLETLSSWDERPGRNTRAGGMRGRWCSTLSSSRAWRSAARTPT